MTNCKHDGDTYEMGGTIYCALCHVPGTEDGIHPSESAKEPETYSGDCPVCDLPLPTHPGRYAVSLWPDGVPKHMLCATLYHDAMNGTLTGPNPLEAKLSDKSKEVVEEVTQRMDKAFADQFVVGEGPEVPRSLAEFLKELNEMLPSEPSPVRLLVTQDATPGEPSKRTDGNGEQEVIIHPEDWGRLRRDVLTDIEPDKLGPVGLAMSMPVVIE